VTRGLHPETRPQRAVADGQWQQPDHPSVESQEPPPRYVAYALAGIIASLLLSQAAVGLLLPLLSDRQPRAPAAAEQRFTSSAPPLLAAPETALQSNSAAHNPQPGAIARVMADVAREGWGEPAPPPNRATTALERAKALQ
jgi:hypothetical protein